MRASRVVLHVGTPKTGTTYLQSVLWRNRALLRERGVLVPGRGSESMFLAALDVMKMDWGGEPHPRAPGRWQALIDEVRDWPGTVVISQELLAGASVDKAREAAGSFAPARIDVVVTARDLLRQVPAEWQEHVKHGRVKSFAEFWTHLQELPPEHELTQAFHRVQDLPEVLERWCAAVPSGEVRLVTVPAAESSTRILWERFVSACAIDAEGCELDVAVGNRSLDTVTTALLRRVNRVLVNAPLRVDQRDSILKGVFANRVLTPLTSPLTQIQVPPDIARSIRVTAQQWRETLQTRDYPVWGDLDDLVPDPVREPALDPPPDPDQVSPADEAQLAGYAVAGLLHQLSAAADDLASTRARAVAAERRRDELQRELDEHRDLPPGLRLRRAVVETADQVGLVKTVLGAYRRARSLWQRASRKQHSPTPSPTPSPGGAP